MKNKEKDLIMKEHLFLTKKMKLEEIGCTQFKQEKKKYEELYSQISKGNLKCKKLNSNTKNNKESEMKKESQKETK